MYLICKFYDNSYSEHFNVSLKDAQSIIEENRTDEDFSVWEINETGTKNNIQCGDRTHNVEL